MADSQQKTLEWIASYVKSNGHNPSRREIDAFTRQQTFEWVAAFITTKGYSPSVREIAAALGLSSINTVDGRLRRLEAAGKIKRTPGIARSIVIVQ